MFILLFFVIFSCRFLVDFKLILCFEVDFADINVYNIDVGKKTILVELVCAMKLNELGLTDQKIKQFNNKGIHTVEDLVRYFPRKYTDFSHPVILPETGCSTVVEGAFIITALKISGSPSTAKKSYVNLFGKDAQTGARVSVFWFGKKITWPFFWDVVPGVNFLVCGKAEFSPEYRTYTVSGPSVFMKFSPDCLRIYPTYSKIPNMSDEYLLAAIEKGLRLPNAISEIYPEEISSKYGLLPLREAIPTLHSPASADALEKAQRRLIFDELFKFSLQLQNAQSVLSKGSQYNLRSMEYVNRVREMIPYALTLDQEGFLNSVFDDMRNGRRVNCLLQADVGAGKTICAIMAIMAMVGSGFQCALMAPSKVLAEQHYHDIAALAEPLGVHVGLCVSVSMMKKKEQEAFLSGVADGSIQIVVGTHSILSPKISFKNLALVVTDEEHKFGVAQRAALVEKASSGVHCITMSATPIPRSLAQVVYGDSIQLYTIHTMPAGRVPVQTAVTTKIDATLRSVERQLVQGHQVFVVCPAITSTDKNERASVETVSDTYSNYFAPKGYRVASLTGKDSMTAMRETISAFAKGDINVLVSTTVIEVGVNIPNATMIVIHDSDCFGLSQLHQLRGRVGRSKFPSFCVLLTTRKDCDRLKIMCQTTSGFDIAKADLAMRGPGDWIGTDQSGSAQPVEFMLAYPDIYECAKTEAASVLRNGYYNWPIVKAALSGEED